MLRRRRRVRVRELVRSEETTVAGTSSNMLSIWGLATPPQPPELVMPALRLPDGRLLSCVVRTENQPARGAPGEAGTRLAGRPNPMPSQAESPCSRAVLSLSKAASKEFSMDLDCSLHGVQRPATDSRCTPSVVTV